LTQNPQWNPTTVTRAEFEQFFDQSVEQFGSVLDTANPDLSAFAKQGGRTIIWHGTVDHALRIRGMTDYIDNIRKTLKPEAADRFLRFYVAPGVGHCSGGEGPQPTHLLEPLMAWVERGKIPGELIAEQRNPPNGARRTGLLCPYPQRSVYRGNGSKSEAAEHRWMCGGKSE
jgi:feruloyl esterase